MPDELSEEIATCDEELLDKFLNSGKIQFDDIRELFKQSRIFPVLFGSALKYTGVNELRDVIKRTVTPYEGYDEFGARIYKISRDDIQNFANKVFSNKPIYSIVASKDTLDYNQDFLKNLENS